MKLLTLSLILGTGLLFVAPAQAIGPPVQVECPDPKFQLTKSQDSLQWIVNATSGKFIFNGTFPLLPNVTPRISLEEVYALPPVRQDERNYRLSCQYQLMNAKYEPPNDVITLTADAKEQFSCHKDKVSSFICKSF